jgi:hypothetical protein
MNEHIQARFPAPLPPDAAMDDVVKQAKYEELIESYMIHKCIGGERGCKDDKGYCKRGYMDHQCTTQTKVDLVSGFPIYARPFERDLTVVPHNRLMLEDWGGHINVEGCSSFFAVLYLYKYLYKGNKKITIHLNNTDDLHPDDEIKHFIRGRMLCSMEAAWKILGYQMYPASVPTVIRVKVKTEVEIAYILGEQDNCDLAVYFARPQIPLFADMKYIEFFKLWMYAKVPPKAFVLAATEHGASHSHPVRQALSNLANIDAAEEGSNSDSNSDYDSDSESDSDNEDGFEERQRAAAGPAPLTANPFSNKSRIGYRLTTLFNQPYIFPRQRDKHQQLVRMSMIPLSSGEKWYIRLLLQHTAPYNHDDLRTVDGHLYATFQEAAIARGLVTSKQECVLSFQEYLPVSSPAELRSHFVQMTIMGYATLNIYNDKDMQKSMMTDYLADTNNSLSRARNLLLQSFSQQLLLDGRTLDEFGLPQPEEDKTELQRAKLMYDKAQQTTLYHQLITVHPLTDEMVVPFERIKQALQTGETLHINIKGKAGCGMTTWAQTVIAYARSFKHLVLGCASTALAAGVYKDDFTTTHYIFGIPVVDDADDYDQENDIQSKLFYAKYAQRRELLMAAKIIFWDEIGSQNSRDFRCAYNATNGFAGKILITIGDNHQITPVIKRGTREQILASSFYQSHFFGACEKFAFTKNLRLIGASPEQLAYAELIDDITVGRYDREGGEVFRRETDEDTSADERAGQTKVVLPTIKTFLLPGQAIDFVHPDGFGGTSIRDSCILAATNERVDHWNTEIQKLNPKPAVDLLSADEIDQCDDPKGYLSALLTTEVLNRFSRSEIPDHKLTLKEGDVCILLRSMDRKRGFTSNRRVRIVKISTFAVRVQLLDEPTAVFAIIPRVTFNATLPYGHSFTIARKQFPLRLAYSLSINKAQGQTLNRVLLDITVSRFSHGHLYVALSRVRLACNIAFFATMDCFYEGAPFVTKTVYSELIGQIF